MSAKCRKADKRTAKEKTANAAVSPKFNQAIPLGGESSRSFPLPALRKPTRHAETSGEERKGGWEWGFCGNGA
jgi:hypothetical protein